MFSIVIPTIGRSSLESLLKSIPSSDLLTSIFIVADAQMSTQLANAVFANIRSHSSHPIHWIRPERVGVNASRNAGIRAALSSAGSQFVLFLDDDVELSKSFSWRNLLSVFGESHLLAIGGNYLSSPGLGLVSRGYNLMCSGWRVASGTADLEALLGGSWCIRSSQLIEVCNEMGWFDEEIQYGGAETLFIHRLRKWAFGKWLIRHHSCLDVIHNPVHRGLGYWFTLAQMQRQKLTLEIKTSLPPFRTRLSRILRFCYFLPIRDLLVFLIFTAVFTFMGVIGARLNIGPKPR
jgi:glycosyltransferase involved in cell wall biosynthesis